MSKQTRDQTVAMKVSKTEKALLDAAAANQDTTVSSFVREWAVAGALQSVEDYSWSLLESGDKVAEAL